jgi:hypothetical protein
MDAYFRRIIGWAIDKRQAQTWSSAHWQWP